MAFSKIHFIQKQIDAFQEALRKRAANVEIRKQEKLVKASEILVKNAKLPPVSPIPPPATPKPRAKSIVQESESDEEEIIIVKTKPKKKKQKLIFSYATISNKGKKNPDHCCESG